MVKLAPAYSETPSVALGNSWNMLSSCFVAAFYVCLSQRAEALKGTIDAFKDLPTEFEYWCCTQTQHIEQFPVNLELQVRPRVIEPMCRTCL